MNGTKEALLDAIAALERVEADLEADLEATRSMLARMRGSTVASGEASAALGPYKDMGIIEASRHYLALHGPQETASLADGLREGGLRSKSRRLVPTVYATLANAAKGPNAQFTRTPEGKWDLTPLSREQEQVAGRAELAAAHG